MIKKILPNLLLSLASIFVGLLILEAAARLLPRLYYDWDFRYMFYSVNPLVRHEGYWLYQPHQTIRSTTVYQFPCQTPVVQYDVRFTTNNLGLVQKQDARRDLDTVAVFGDSFTEGQGATPWFYDFENDATAILPAQTQLLNFAQQGDGPPNWLNEFKDFSKNYHFKKALFIIIGEDWMRGAGNFSDEDMACFANPAICQGDRWFSTALDTPEDELLRITNQRSLAHHGNEPQACISGWLQRYSRLYRQIKHWEKMSTKDVQSFMTARQSKHTENTAVLTTMMTAMGGPQNVVMVVVPMRDEADRGRLSDNTQAVIKSVQEAGLTNLVTCTAMNGGDFYNWDGHPNAAGYKKVRACAVQALQLLYIKNK